MVVINAIVIFVKTVSELLTLKIEINRKHYMLHAMMRERDWTSCTFIMIIGNGNPTTCFERGNPL